MKSLNLSNHTAGNNYHIDSKVNIIAIHPMADELETMLEKIYE